MKKQRRRKNRKGVNVTRQRWTRAKRGVSRNLRAEPLEDRRLLTALAGDVDYNLHHNYIVSEDVNEDWHVSPVDALSVINDLNRSGSRTLSPSDADSLDGDKVDVNNDGSVSPLDALKAINAMNGKEGENGTQKFVEISLEGQAAENGERVVDENGVPLPMRILDNGQPQPIDNNRVKVGDRFAIAVTVDDLREGADALGVFNPVFDIGYQASYNDPDMGETILDTELFTIDGADPSETGADTDSDGVAEFDLDFFKERWFASGVYSSINAFPWQYKNAPGEDWNHADGDSVPDEFDEVRAFTLNGPGANPVPVMHVELTAAELPVDQPGTITFTSNVAETLPIALFPDQELETGNADQILFNSTSVEVFRPVYARDDSVETPEDTPITFSVDGNDQLDDQWAAENPSAALDGPTNFTQPSNGSVTLSGNQFTYTPPANYNNDSGTLDSFTYTMTDGLGNTDTATVTITVNAVNDPVEAVDDSYSVLEDNTLTVPAEDGVLANDVDQEGDPLEAALTSDVSHGALTLNADGSFTYTPSENFNGEDSFQYRADDGDATSDPATVTITVDPVNDAPIAEDDSYSTDEDVALTVTDGGVLANDIDVDDDPLTAAIETDPSEGTVTLNSNGSFTYTPNENFNGEDSFTYRANDGTADSNIATVTITVDSVNDAPVAGDDSYSTDEDEPLSVPANNGVLVNDSDVEDDSLEAALESGPDNGTLRLDSEGSFTYTPNENFNSQDSFTYRANDGTADSDVATVTITVNPVNDAPVATEDTYETNEDEPLAVDAPGVLGNDSDVDGDDLTASVVTEPSHGTVDLVPDDGSFSYTPEADFFGDDSFTYEASDETLESDPVTVSITVNAVNDVPIPAEGPWLATERLTEEDPKTVLHVLKGPDLGSPDDDAKPGPDNESDQELFLPEGSIIDEPSAGTLVQEGNTFVFTPPLNVQAGPQYTFTYTIADDAGGTTEATGTIDLVPFARPYARDDSFSMEEDGELEMLVGSPEDTEGLLSNDLPNPGEVLDFKLPNELPGELKGPDHGTITESNGVITYVPESNYFGEDTFEYQIDDDFVDNEQPSEPSVGLVTITVTPVNDAPEAEDGSVTTDEDTPVDVTLVAEDVEDDPLTYSFSDPDHGTLSGTAPNLTYTPAADFSGSDSFTFTVNDGSVSSNQATVSITIGPVNDAPVAEDDSYRTDEDVPLTVGVDDDGVLNNDSDVDDDALEAERVSGPDHGSLTLNSDGSFDYTPELNFNGTDSFTYNASDGVVTSNEATVSITVEPVNDAPVAGDDEYSVDEDTTLDVAALGVLGNDSDVDDDPLTAVLVAGPSEGELDLNEDGSFEYTPAANFFGSDSFTYRANDGADDSNEATVSITVNPVNDAPTAFDKFKSGIQEDSTGNLINVTLGDLVGEPGGKTDLGDSITLQSVGTPSEDGDASMEDGKVSYTPKPDFFGTETFEYTIVDSEGLTDTATVTVFVENVNDPPTVKNEDGQEGARLMALKGFEAQELEVLGNDSFAPDEGEELTLKELIGEGGARGTEVETEHGTVSISEDGKRVIYTPDEGFETQEGEYDSFGYVVQDDSGAENDSAEGRAEIEVIDAVPSDVSGVVYIDANSDGQQQADELTLAGVEVSLTGTNLRGADVEMTAETDVNGEFVFSGVLPTAENDETGYTITAEQPSFLHEGADEIIDPMVDESYDPGELHDDNHVSGMTLDVWGADGRAIGNYAFGEGGLRAEYIKLTQFLGSSDPTMMLAGDGQGDTYWFSIMKGWEGVKSVSFQFDDPETSEGLATAQLTVTDTNDEEHTRSLQYYQDYDYSGDPNGDGVVVFLQSPAEELGFGNLFGGDLLSRAEGEMPVDAEDLERLAEGGSSQYEEAVDAVFSGGNWA